MLALPVAALSYAPVTASARASPKMNLGDISFDQKPWTSGEISDKAGMVALANKLNPTVGFWGEIAPDVPGTRCARYPTSCLLCPASCSFPCHLLVAKCPPSPLTCAQTRLAS